MSRAQSLLFGVAVVFAGWNILNNGLSVRSGAIALLIIICLVINIYNNNQKKAQQEEAMAKIREKEEIRRIRAEARRKQGKKHKVPAALGDFDGNSADLPVGRFYPAGVRTYIAHEARGAYAFRVLVADTVLYVFHVHAFLYLAGRHAFQS